MTGERMQAGSIRFLGAINCIARRVRDASLAGPLPPESDSKLKSKRSQIVQTGEPTFSIS
jgi:hypothetical protein